LKLGVIGVVALVLVTIATIAVGGQGGFPWQRYPLKARFHDVNGLKTGAVVRLNGKEVGKVTSVEFAGSEIEVVSEVSDKVRRLITTASEATMGSLSLLGETDHRRQGVGAGDAAQGLGVCQKRFRRKTAFGDSDHQARQKVWKPLGG
jgi:hypothetical protein